MIDRDEVRHIAKLARLELTEAELGQLQGHLAAILDYMQILRELDTSKVAETAQITPRQNVTRPDEVESSLPPEQALANSPQQEDGLFRVPPLFE
ncbi:MAG: Asp-tRNA(Asn)/Glu-tRNA(Gln) amidotransferase subunit GatC [Chloroflexia bacterium]|nr:Asp-tRNA(Asn)/Glu-tRNA(Gln) amidotransferase subunit GatC [Chloroflexia bacterium]